MNQTSSIIILVILFSAISVNAEVGDTLYISRDSLSSGRLYLSNFPEEIMWRYSEGDHPSWASPEYNDCDWDLVDPWMDMQKFDYSNWKCICWFRKVIKIDSTLLNTSIGIYVHHEGASEIFLNGKKILTFGKVSANRKDEITHDPKFAPYVLNFDTSKVYTIAVRYSNHSAEGNDYFYNKFFSHLGFSIFIFDFNENIENNLLDYYEMLAYGWGLDGFTLAFSIIFFLLYLFYSKRKENLYFSLFIFGISLFGGASNMQSMGPAPQELEAFYRFMQFGGVSLTFTFFLLFIYQIVYKKVIKLFWYFLIAFILVNIFAFVGSEGIFSYMLPLGIIIGIMAVESIRVFIVGIKRKVEHIGILSTGAGLFLFLTLLGALLSNILPRSIFESAQGVLMVLSIIVLPISMAIYLAKSYANTNDDLEEQLVAVKDLSAKQIEQERKNAELQLQAELERKENERKSIELEQARSLQLSMLPKEIPSLPELDIAVYMKTATEVGGDYYDFYLSEDNALTAVLGDATGHGLNAGMMVSVTKGLFQNLAGMPDLEESFHQFNRSIYSMGIQPLLMALSAVRIRNRKFEIISAGMPEMYFYEKEKDVVVEIESSGPPLGSLAKFPYKLVYTADINPGDIILMMSDGFTERFNEQNEMFGCERCKNLFLKNALSTPKEIIDLLLNEENLWGGNRAPDDDITFVVIKCN